MTCVATAGHDGGEGVWEERSKRRRGLSLEKRWHVFTVRMVQPVIRAWVAPQVWIDDVLGRNGPRTGFDRVPGEIGEEERGDPEILRLAGLTDDLSIGHRLTCRSHGSASSEGGLLVPSGASRKDRAAVMRGMIPDRVIGNPCVRRHSFPQRIAETVRVGVLSRGQPLCSTENAVSSSRMRRQINIAAARTLATSFQSGSAIAASTSATSTCVVSSRAI